MMYNRINYISKVLIITCFVFVSCKNEGDPLSPQGEEPAVPTGLTATSGEGELTLNWNANSEADLSHYNIFQGNSSGNLEEVAEVPAGMETYTPSGLENGILYYFAVNAENNDGLQSGMTDEVSASIGPIQYASSWIKQFGSSERDGFDAIGMAEAGDGTLWIVSNLHAPYEGVEGPFVARFNSQDGNLQSIEQLDFSADPIRPAAISFPDDGGYLIAGWLQDALPGETRTGVSDVFLAKFDDSGTYVWGKQIGVESKWTEGEAMDISPSGDIYVTGNISSGASLPGQTSSGGGRDVFLIKYNSAGEIIWMRQFGNGSDRLYNQGVSVIDGEIMVMGTLTDQHAPLPGSASGGNAFIRRYNELGDDLETIQFDVPIGTNEGAGMVMDPSGMLWAFGSAYEDPFNYGSDGSQDFLMTKIDPATGESIAAAQLGTPETEWGQGIAIGANGVIYVGGTTDGSFEGYVNAGDYDIAISRLELP